MSGMTGYLAGISAEDIAAMQYVRQGYGVKAQRWRGMGGEIDLIVDDGEMIRSI